MTRAPRLKPNTTITGELACAFRTPWRDHFEPPVGTGKGCVVCDTPGATCPADDPACGVDCPSKQDEGIKAWFDAHKEEAQ